MDAYGALKIFRIGKKLMFCDAARPLDITNPEDRTVIVTQLEAAAAERRKIQYRTQRKKEELIKDPTVSVTRLPNGVIHIKVRGESEPALAPTTPPKKKRRLSAAGLFAQSLQEANGLDGR